MEITVLVEEELEVGSNLPGWLGQVVETVLTAEGASPAAEVSVVVAGQARVHELNREYLDEDRPTDVLSFPMSPSDPAAVDFVSPPDGLVHLGEIIISLPQTLQQANEHGHSIDMEFAILTIHGVLHLLGYDHAEPEEEGKMRAKETSLLERIYATL